MLYGIYFFFFSAYCGSLWLAALYVTITMANMIGEHDIANELSDTLTKGKHSFEKKLWNGNNFKYFSRRLKLPK